MLDRNVLLPVGTVSVSAGFLHLRGGPIDKLVNRLKSEGKIKLAVAVRNQNLRFNRINLSSHNGDRNAWICFVAAEYLVGDERLLFHYPQRPVKRSGTFPVPGKNQHTFTPVVSLLNKLEQPPVLSTGTDVMKSALLHSVHHGTIQEKRQNRAEF
jgi:hypothetical protein